MTLTCPACGEIPNDEAMGHEIRGGYDGVLYWSHMTCGTAFHRWAPENRGWLHAEAERYIKEHNEGAG